MQVQIVFSLFILLLLFFGRFVWVVCNDFFMLYNCYIASFNLVCCLFVH